MPNPRMVEGYLAAAYAAALFDVGDPVRLAASGGWLLRRRIPGRGDADAMGCYPLFCCVDWTTLESDLLAQSADLVSVALVADPFGRHDRDLLGRLFGEGLHEFKPHYVIELSQWTPAAVHPHHRRNVRYSAREVDVEIRRSPDDWLEDWVRLYAVLKERHAISGIAAFSPESFRRQFGVPGLVAARATHHGQTVGMVLFYVQGDVAYYHLGACNSHGYALRAGYALLACVIGHFANEGLGFVNLGAGAGVDAHRHTGLARFKAGWSTTTRMAYFCGRIFDRPRYEALTAAAGRAGTTYFPAYRAGEFS